MKLPDFLQSPEFNRLREKMGGAKLGDFITNIDYTNTLTKEQLEQLGNKGIDVSFEDLTFLTDGTIALKDSRAILYIRDISNYNENKELPKFHISNCKTLQEMKSKGRQLRYVVTTRDDGLFNVITINGTSHSENEEILNVCKNCLSELNWPEFKHLDKTSKDTFVKEFIIKDFFNVFYKKYDKELLSGKGFYSDRTAPLNKYPNNWNELSKKTKEERGNRCEECSASTMPLDTHHIDGNKFNNNNENLKVLCRNCHQKQPYHSHMR